MKAGMRGPLVFSGHSRTNSYYNAVCKVMQRPAGSYDDPESQKLFIEGWRQLFDHAAEKKWPEIVWLPNDEPTMRSSREARMTMHRRTVKMLRENFPKVRIYGVCMDKLANAQMLADSCDILVCNGDSEQIVKLGKEKGKTVWFYGMGAAAAGYEHVRARYGLPSFSYGPSGMFFWSQNYFMGDPYNEFDGERPDSAWNINWPPLKKGGPMVESIVFEGLRAGVNDVRYALTLEKLLAARRDDEAAKVKAEYQDIHTTLMRTKQTVPAARDKITGWILQLSEK
jgi:hypothetical protein